MEKREYRIVFNNPLYYLEVKYKIWFIPFWTAIEYSADYDYIEKLFAEKTNGNEKS